jgi:hypothetical protein
VRTHHDEGSSISRALIGGVAGALGRGSGSGFGVSTNQHRENAAWPIRGAEGRFNGREEATLKERPLFFFQILEKSLDQSKELRKQEGQERGSSTSKQASIKTSA